MPLLDHPGPKDDTGIVCEMMVEVLISKVVLRARTFSFYCIVVERSTDTRPQIHDSTFMTCRGLSPFHRRYVVSPFPSFVITQTFGRGRVWVQFLILGTPLRLQTRPRSNTGS
jgi:hypothetical protein